MPKPEEMHRWLEISKHLLESLLPEKTGIDVYGHDLAPNVFAELLDREYEKVDQVLIAMSTAEDEQQAKVICSQMDGDTSIALFSRWAQYTSHWQRHPNPGHWFPSSSNDTWRAIFLSMTQDRGWSKDMAKPLLAEWFLELQ